MIYQADNFRIDDEVGAITDQDATQLSENLHNLARQFGTCMKIAETPLLSQISGFVRFLYIFMILINAVEIGSNPELSSAVGSAAICKFMKKNVFFSQIGESFFCYQIAFPKLRFLSNHFEPCLKSKI